MERNVGRTIKNGYCNGLFGRRYDLAGSVILAEGECWIVIRIADGEVAFTDFQYNDPERGWKPTGNKQGYLDDWCSGHHMEDL